MKKNKLARRILWMMRGCIVLAVVMVVGTLAWTAREHNRKAVRDSMVMVGGGLAAATRELRTLNVDYSVWDVAYRHAMARDLDWIMDNMVEGIADGSFDLMTLVWPETGEEIGWENRDGDIVRAPSLPAEVRLFLAEALRPVAGSDFKPVDFAFRLPEGVYHFTASRIQPFEIADGANREAFPINLMGRRLDGAIIARLGRMFLIDDLQVAESPKRARPSVPVAGVTGEPVAHLVWTAPRPGAELIRTASLPLLAALTLLATVTMLANRTVDTLAEREEESARAARTDNLTGLPNRMAFRERLERCTQVGDGELAILFMDVNGFKAVNDMLGHAAGDLLVVQLSRRLEQCLPADTFLARVGGDEFNVIVTGGQPEQQVQAYAARVTEALAPPFRIEGKSFGVSVAMGFCSGLAGSMSSGELIRRADLAMYEAKNLRMERPLRYHAELEHDRAAKKVVEDALRAALVTCDEFQMYYQPIVNAQTGALASVEALIRWNSAELGWISPGDFIPVAESCGVIRELGMWVIEQVCRDLAGMPEIKAGINISPAQLLDPEFAWSVRETLARHAVASSRVEFELTEGLIVESPDLAAFRLDQLREAGHPIALDDFGTGFSSIGYLRRMNFTKLKVDKSFIDEIGLRENADDLLRSLVLLARALDLEVVAEGVEAEVQARRLCQLGVDLLQGYHFGKPMPLADLKKFARARAA
jgi:diguanylate cyclase (GGDEF)-like protein